MTDNDSIYCHYLFIDPVHNSCPFNNSFLFLYSADVDKQGRGSEENAWAEKSCLERTSGNEYYSKIIFKWMISFSLMISFPQKDSEHRITIACVLFSTFSNTDMREYINSKSVKVKRRQIMYMTDFVQSVLIKLAKHIGIKYALMNIYIGQLGMALTGGHKTLNRNNKA